MSSAIYAQNQKQKSIQKEFLLYVIPSVISMVVSSLYVIVDGVFVGRGVGESALAAVNIIYPFNMLQIAMTMLIAIGGANYFSRYIGERKHKEANNFFLQSIIGLILISILINVFVLIFPEQVASLLGADETLMPLVLPYLKWIALFGIIYMPGLGLSIFVRNDGAPKLAMIGTLAGAILNIILDYVFIMEFGWGISGAAIATGIGETIAGFIFLIHFLKKDRMLRIRKPVFKIGNLKKITLSGIPSFLMEFSQSAVAFSFNWAILLFVGTIGISAYSVVMYVCSIFNMFLIGIIQGAQPLLSFNYGSRNKENVQKIYKLGLGSNLISTSLFYFFVFFFGSQLAGIFLPGNTELIQMSSEMMKIYMLGFFPIGISLMNILYFQVTEKEGRSILISALRCVGFVQLFLLILPQIFGIYGLYAAFFCGEMCNCLLSVVLYKRSRRKERRQTESLKNVSVA
ncbi:MATE family efflux transporter [Methanimicrococcus blatticola]|uniref:Multidrug export protein MepA n=1 Tax=Methanimicrococcus blatticola TaxID=91560 RepID=A0A484F6D4_9EURY|nr:MATE family efflux transporter [Methanimicrococcus blatticola]MBZ3935916.1 MATE family efflux transporter [Methanimicrococcus blatticola]MCC2509471.1 MATE family efflux transporter [Methanimicrococcus blatticola]TDQ68347.1 putative MATE family efflux protein [Methanimicrococcus blatticola]